MGRRNRINMPEAIGLAEHQYHWFAIGIREHGRGCVESWLDKHFMLPKRIKAIGHKEQDQHQNRCDDPFEKFTDYGHD